MSYNVTNEINWWLYIFNANVFISLTFPSLTAILYLFFYYIIKEKSEEGEEEEEYGVDFAGVGDQNKLNLKKYSSGIRVFLNHQPGK